MQIFDLADNINVFSLEERVKRAKTITANIANNETPGYKAIGYNFEDNLKNYFRKKKLKTTDPRHIKFNNILNKSKTYIRKSSHIKEDGNSVWIDGEMSKLAKNQILYKAAIGLLNKKIGILRYSITGGN